MNRFWIVDVFAERPGGGNPLAVVVLDEAMADARMQAVAAEFGFSETTFTTPGRDAHGAFPTRIFTPRAELPFAGHPTLGTAAVIRSQLGVDDVGIELALPVGPVPVRRAPTGIEWMAPPSPALGAIVEARGEVAAALGLGAGDLHGDLPIQAASVGIDLLIVPLRDPDALGRARPADAAGVGPAPRDGLLVFCPAAADSEDHVRVRVFAPSHGILEDPATGSANSCLARYLVEHRVFGDGPLDVRVAQGHAMGRPSRLHLQVDRDGALRVGGRVRPFAHGRLD